MLVFRLILCEYHITNYIIDAILSKPEQTGQHFVYDISKCIFLRGNIRISILISLPFVPVGVIDQDSSVGPASNWNRHFTDA